MKLYATVTSERASKGQGGNKHLHTVYMAEMADGTRKELCHVYIAPCKEGYAIHISDHYGNDLYQEVFEDDTKGEKQKGEQSIEEVQRIWNKSGGHQFLD